MRSFHLYLELNSTTPNRYYWTYQNHPLFFEYIEAFLKYSGVIPIRARKRLPRHQHKERTRQFPIQTVAF